MAGVTGQQVTLGIAKQTAKGTPQPVSAYKLKLTGGDVAPVRDIFMLAETDSSRQQGKSIVVGERIEGAPSFYIRPDDFGLLAYLLLGANADSGAGPYVHTATIANTLPYCTIMKAVQSTVLVDQYQDCRVTGMKISGAAGQPLSCQVDLHGLIPTFGATDAAAAVVTQDPLVYPQVTVTKGGSAPGTVESFEINISNGNTFVQADKTLTPYESVSGEVQVSGVITVLFESDSDYRKFHTAASGGTALSPALFTETLDILATVTANLSVDFNMNSVAYTAYPVVPDPGGAPIKVAIGFQSMPDPAIANYFKIITKNNVVTY